MRLCPATKSSLLLAGGLKLLELSFGLKGSVDGILDAARLCSKLSDRRRGNSCWTRLAPLGDAAFACGLWLDVLPLLALPAVPLAWPADAMAAPSLANFIGSCCLMGNVLASATTAFCSFLALIKFMGKGKLLQLSRLWSPALLAEPIPAVFDPPEIVFRLPKSTEEGVGEGRSDVALAGAAGGGGEEALVTSVSSADVGLTADAIGAVETIVMLGLSKMPWPRRASSF